MGNTLASRVRRSNARPRLLWRRNSRYTEGEIFHKVVSVFELASLLATGLFAFIVGIGAGVVFTRRLSIDGRKQRDLERSVDQLLRQQKDYQHQVVEHFTDTAKLLNNLAESYRDVHNHLAAGANNLCDDDAGTILKRIPESGVLQTLGESDPSAVQAPLDYAPKASPYATGVLNEEFGLEKRITPADESAQVIKDQPVVEAVAEVAADPAETPEPEAVSK
jgi:uncharacterized membrane-anchored protein YhcB (DUF1043 family)